MKYTLSEEGIKEVRHLEIGTAFIYNKFPYVRLGACDEIAEYTPKVFVLNVVGSCVALFEPNTKVVISKLTIESK